MIVVKADYFVRLSPFVSDDEDRYYLSGVHVEPHPGGAALAATNGHLLGSFYDEGGHATRAATVHPSAALKKLCTDRKIGSDATRWLVLRDDDVLVVCEGPDADAVADFVASGVVAAGVETLGMIFGGVVDGDFPDWRKLLDEMPEDADGRPAFFQLDIVKKLSSISAGNKQPVKIRVTGPDKPATVTSDAYPEFFGLIMPIRDDAKELPPWWRAEAPRRAA